MQDVQQDDNADNFQDGDGCSDDVCYMVSAKGKWKNLHRTNFGVVLNDLGNLKSSSTFWYHHFVVQLPDMSDVLPAKCLKRLLCRGERGLHFRVCAEHTQKQIT